MVFNAHHVCERSTRLIDMRGPPLTPTHPCVQAEAARGGQQSPMVQRNSSFATSHEVWKYISELGISKVAPP